MSDDSEAPDIATVPTVRQVLQGLIDPFNLSDRQRTHESDYHKKIKTSRLTCQSFAKADDTRAYENKKWSAKSRTDQTRLMYDAKKEDRVYSLKLYTQTTTADFRHQSNLFFDCHNVLTARDDPKLPLSTLSVNRESLRVKPWYISGDDENKNQAHFASNSTYADVVRKILDDSSNKDVLDSTAVYAREGYSFADVVLDDATVHFNKEFGVDSQINGRVVEPGESVNGFHNSGRLTLDKLRLQIYMRAKPASVSKPDNASTSAGRSYLL